MCDFSEEEVQSPQPSLEATEVKESNRKTLASLGDKPKISAEPKDSDRDKNFRRPLTRETQTLQTELLNNPVFIQWWISRVEKSDFAAKLVKTPRAYVLGKIRSKPETARDMFDSFQVEVTSRVENFNLRQQNDCVIRKDFGPVGRINHREHKP